MESEKEQPKQGRSQKKKFAGDTIAFATSQILIKLLGVFSLAILTHAISPDLYGVWVQIGVTVGLLQPIITFGFLNTMVRYTTGEDDPRDISSLYHYMMGVVILSCAVVLAILMGYTAFFSFAMFGDAKFAEYVPFVALILVLETLYNMNTAFMRSQHKVVVLSILNVARSLISIVIFYVVFLIFHENFVFALTMLILMYLAMTLIVYYQEVVRIVGIHFYFPQFWKTTKDIFTYSLPFIPNGILYWVTAASDRYFIVHLLGLEQNAIYSVAYQLSQVLMMFYTAITFVAYPFLVSYWKKDQKHIVRSILHKTTKWQIFFTIPGAIGLAVVGPYVVTILATKFYTVSPSLIFWISIGILFLGIYQMNTYVMFLVKKTYINTIIFFGSAGINAGLNWIFIPVIGIEAAAISTFISYLFLAIVVSWVAKREVNYRVDWWFAIKCCIATLLMLVVLLQIHITDKFMLGVAVVAGSLTYLIAVYFLRCFSAEDINDVKHLLGLDKGEFSLSRLLQR